MGDSSQLNRKQALALCHYAGFRGKKLVQAVSIMGAESAREYLAFYVDPNGTTDRGLFQINDGAHPDFPDESAYLPIPNVRYAFKLSNGGKNWGPWATFGSGKYLVNIPIVAATLAAEKLGLWKKSIAEREVVFARVGDEWIPANETS